MNEGGRENGHRAIVGVTRSGKTTLAQVLAAGLHSRGRFVGVFDPRSTPRQWKCDVWTRSPYELLAWAQAHNSRSVGKPIYLFWDEWGAYVGRGTKRAEPFKWLGTTSRHNGQTQVVIAQAWRDIDPTLREQVDQVYAFCTAHRSAAMLADAFNRPELEEELQHLPRLFFKEVTRFAESRSGSISFSRGGVRVKLTTPKVVRV